MENSRWPSPGSTACGRALEPYPWDARELGEDLHLIRPPIPEFTILGGLGRAYGPILGSVLITPLALFLQGGLGGQISGLNLFVYSTVVIVVLIVIPNGIGPTLLKRIRRGEP